MNLNERALAEFTEARKYLTPEEFELFKKMNTEIAALDRRRRQLSDDLRLLKARFKARQKRDHVPTVSYGRTEFLSA